MNIEVLSTKTNYQTMKINGYYIHSRYNPIKEAENFAKTHYKPNRVHILYGYGLGYFAKALLNEFKFDEILVVIDPFQDISEREEKILYVDKQNYENLYLFLSAVIADGITVEFIISPNYDKFEIETLRDVADRVLNRSIENRLVDNTINYSTRLWYENIIYNLLYATEDHSFNELVDNFDVPIVIAAGGPSLIKQLPLLKKYRDKVVLLSAGSTVNSLIKEGITPDYIVNIDGSKEDNIVHYSNLDGSNIPYIYCMSATHEVRKFFKGRSYYFNFTGMHINDVVKKEIFNDDIPETNGGISVAVFCLTLAVQMTKGPIALIGQDLAFTNNMTHAPSNKNHQYIDENTNNYKKIKGYYGDEVLTDSSLIAMRDNFNAVVKLFKKDYKVFNCTEGGAEISTIPPLPFKDFLEANATKKVQDKHKGYLIDSKIRKDNYVAYLKEELKLANDTIIIVKESLLVLKRDRLKKQFDTKNVKILNKNNEQMYSNLDKFTSEILFKKIAANTVNYYLPKLNETKEEEFDRVYKQQEYLYESLLEDVKFIKNCIEEVVFNFKNGSTD